MASAQQDIWNRFEAHAKVVLEDLLPRETDSHLKNPLPGEIAKRLVNNLKIVGRDGIYREMLIVLADYHAHAWAGGKLAVEGRRIATADSIMRGLKPKVDDEASCDGSCEPMCAWCSRQADIAAENRVKDQGY
jgi:hypothetical protein